MSNKSFAAFVFFLSVLIWFAIGVISKALAGNDYDQFTPQIIERHKLREINGKLGTLCEGILTGQAIVSLSRNGNLFAAIDTQNERYVAEFLSRQKYISFVDFKDGQIAWISISAPKQLRDYLNEIRGIIR